MLSVLKNELVTGVSKQTVLLRKRELDWFCHNYWIIATQVTVIAGFSFRELMSTAHMHFAFSPSSHVSTTTYTAHWGAVTAHVFFTSLSLTSSLYVIVRATFACMFAPGLALRGPDGFGSMHKALDVLRREQDRILWCFMLALSCFVFSSFMVVHLYRGHKRTAVRLQALLLVVVLSLLYFAWRITLRFYHHRSTTSGIHVIEQAFTGLHDLDAATASRDVASEMNAYHHQTKHQLHSND
eukprot:GHVS01003106.1.p1 GENE.GHVS01003106.1~~GHVS01003106.1.p1  ORF type:complete len:240 (-),score=24.32 GHVS01003106.1:157-876(-)